jgi:hypothetical protein
MANELKESGATAWRGQIWHRRKEKPPETVGLPGGYAATGARGCAGQRPPKIAPGHRGRTEKAVLPVRYVSQDKLLDAKPTTIFGDK